MTLDLLGSDALLASGPQAVPGWDRNLYAHRRRLPAGVLSVRGLKLGRRQCLRMWCYAIRTADRRLTPALNNAQRAYSINRRDRGHSDEARVCGNYCQPPASAHVHGGTRARLESKPDYQEIWMVAAPSPDQGLTPFGHSLRMLGCADSEMPGAMQDACGWLAYSVSRPGVRDGR